MKTHKSESDRDTTPLESLGHLIASIFLPATPQYYPTLKLIRKHAAIENALEFGV